MGHAKDQKASPNGRELGGPLRSSALTTRHGRGASTEREARLSWSAAGQRLRHHLRAVDNVADRNERLSPRASIAKASMLRFRPIMMTTLAALFGALPLALDRSAGSELRFPLGITIKAVCCSASCSPSTRRR